MDRFTELRLIKFVKSFREKSGQLPTWNDFENGGFDRELIKEAVRSKIVEEFYVKLTSGTIVKGFKLVQD